MLRRAALLTLSLTATSCILEDNRCGPGQVEQDEELEGCTCAPGHVPAANGRSCEPCTGANQEAKGNTCACIAGYSKQGGECLPTPDAGTTGDSGTTPTAPTGVGAACTNDSDCASYDAKFCQNLQQPAVCLVKGCATGATTCFGDQVCCDFSSVPVPSLQQAGGLCVPTCSAPGVVVP